MKKVLVINSHPRYQDKENSITVQLKDYTLELLSRNSNIEVETLDLYAPDFFLPRIEEDMFYAWGGSNLTEQQQNISDRQNELIEQFIAADYVFIFSPLHNFNVTSRFKDYIDNIFIARRTFRYTENGSVGLLDNSKRIAYIQVSGGVYTQDLRYIHLDIAPYYVRSVFAMMGITTINVLRVEGTNLGIDGIVEKAKRDLGALIEKMD